MKKFKKMLSFGDKKEKGKKDGERSDEASAGMPTEGSPPLEDVDVASVEPTGPSDSDKKPSGLATNRDKGEAASDQNSAHPPAAKPSGETASPVDDGRNKKSEKQEETPVRLAATGPAEVLPVASVAHPHGGAALTTTEATERKPSADGTAVPEPKPSANGTAVPEPKPSANGTAVPKLDLGKTSAASDVLINEPASTSAAAAIEVVPIATGNKLGTIEQPRPAAEPGPPLDRRSSASPSSAKESRFRRKRPDETITVTGNDQEGTGADGAGRASASGPADTAVKPATEAVDRIELNKERTEPTLEPSPAAEVKGKPPANATTPRVDRVPAALTEGTELNHRAVPAASSGNASDQTSVVSSEGGHRDGPPNNTSDKSEESIREGKIEPIIAEGLSVEADSALRMTGIEAVQGSEDLYAQRQMSRQRQLLQAEQDAREDSAREAAVWADEEDETLQEQRGRVSRIHRRNRANRENSIAADISLSAAHRDSLPLATGVKRKVVLNGAQAVLRLQAAYRARRVRRTMRRQSISATEIQRIYRGRKTRVSVRAVAGRIREVEAIEKDRRSRLQRIKAQERELVILKQMPADEYMDYDRVRQTNSARMLQRCWRRVIEAKNKFRGSRGTKQKVDEKQLAVKVDQINSRFVREVTKRMQDDVAFMRESGMRPKLHTEVALQIEMDAIGLSELMERVKTSASDKQRDRVNDFGGEGGLRKKYQDLFERRQMAAVMVESFHETAEPRKRDQYDRLYSLGHCKQLLEQLSSPHLPSLDEAKEMILNRRKVASGESKQDWVADLADFNVDALRVAARDHFDTCNTLTGAAKKKWSVVTSPHDVMEPPVDLLRIRETLDSRHRRTPHNSTQQLRDKGQLESLYWVAFAAQRSQFDPNTGVRVSRPNNGLSKLKRADGSTVASLKIVKQEAGDNIDEDNLTTFDDVDMDICGQAWDEGKTPHELMGEVDSGKFLKDLSVQVLQAQQRSRTAVVGENKPIGDDESGLILPNVPLEIRKRDILAKRYIAEAASYRRLHNDKRRNIGMAKEELLRREQAACRIQAIGRGKRDRGRVKAIKAEQRVVMALQLLMSELGNPELRGKGKDIVNNLNVNISNANLRQQLQLMAEGQNKAASITAISASHQFGNLAHKPTVNPLNLSSARPLSNSSSAPPVGQAGRPAAIFTDHDAMDEHRRMAAQTNLGTPFASDTSKETPFKSGDKQPTQKSAQTQPQRTQALQPQIRRRVMSAAASDDDLVISTPLDQEDSDPYFYQSPDSYGEGQDQFNDESADHIDRLEEQSVAAADRHGLRTQFMPSVSLSGPVSLPLVVTPNRFRQTEVAVDDDLLSPQTPLSRSPLSNMRHRFAPPTEPSAVADEHGLSASDLHGTELSLSKSNSSPMRFLEGDIKSTLETPREPQARGYDQEPLLRLKIPRVSKGVYGAMKTAADVVLNGGSSDIETIVDDGMSFPAQNFDKVAGLRILQDLALVCGVLPLVEWLSSFSTLDPASKAPAYGPRSSPRDIMQYCYIPIDFACSLLAELGTELGVVTLRESPNARGQPAPHTALREGQTQLVHMCVLLRLLAAGGEGELGLPIADLRSLLEDEWLASTDPPETGSRAIAALAEMRSLLICETSRRGTTVCAVNVFDECLNQRRLTLTEAPDAGADEMLGPDDIVLIYECLIRNRKRARRNNDARALRPGELNPYIYQLTKSDAAVLIQLCLWEGLTGSGGTGVTPGSSAKSDFGLAHCVVSSTRFRSWMCAHPVSSSSLQKKAQAMLRAIPTAVTALISESVVFAGGTHVGGARKHVTVSNFARAVERATVLPLTRTEAVSIGKLLLRLQAAQVIVENAAKGADDCFVDLSLLENIRTGQFL